MDEYIKQTKRLNMVLAFNKHGKAKELFSNALQFC